MQQTQTPRTGAELRALRDKREELIEQVNSAAARREGLAQQRLNARARGDEAMVQEYDASIRELGDRVKRLEREKLQADDAISEAISRRVGQSDQAAREQQIHIAPIPSFPPMPDIGRTRMSGTLFPDRNVGAIREEYQKMMMAEAVGLILLGAIVCRVVWNRAMRKAAKLGAAGGDLLGLRQSVDSIAVEVERISENQRYVTKLLTEAPASLHQPKAEPVEVAIDRNAPRLRSER